MIYGNHRTVSTCCHLPPILLLCLVRPYAAHSFTALMNDILGPRALHHEAPFVLGVFLTLVHILFATCDLCQSVVLTPGHLMDSRHPETTPSHPSFVCVPDGVLLCVLGLLHLPKWRHAQNKYALPGGFMPITSVLCGCREACRSLTLPVPGKTGSGTWGFLGFLSTYTLPLL